MRITINIDFKPHKTTEFNRVSDQLRNLYESITLLEMEMEKDRQWLEKLEERTTHLKSEAEEE